MIDPIDRRAVGLHPDATRALILGVLGVALCPFVAPFAWRESNRVLAEIDGSGIVTGNRPYAVGGRICGIAGTVIWGVVAVVLVGLAVVGAVGALLD